MTPQVLPFRLTAAYRIVKFPARPERARLVTQVVMQAEAEKVEDTLSAQTHMELEALLSAALILDWGNNPLLCD